MKLIDADALYEQTAEWEASALHHIEELNRTPLAEMDDDERSEWRKWTAILAERSAFKHDVADAPTIDVPDRKVGKWEQKEDPYGFFDTIPVCSICGCTTKMRETYRYCPNCGAEMVDKDINVRSKGEDNGI